MLISLLCLFVAAVAYAYFGYPVLLIGLGFLFRRASDPRPETVRPSIAPSVSLIISAYNEERVIEQKILNSINLVYPRELLEVLVVSDGSTDQTDAIARKYESDRVILLRYEGRLGKTACLNMAVRAASGDIVVFTDANSIFGSGAVKALVRNFRDPSIGFVTGHTSYVVEKNGELTGSVGMYAQLEKLSKRLESRLSSCVGADGAIFAVRKDLFRELSADDINDLVIPLRVVRQGFRGILEEDAVCSEGMAVGFADEFRRQVRIGTRTIRAVWTNADLLDPFRYGIFAVQFFSHKVAKLLVPGFLLCILSLTAWLSVDSRFFVYLLMAQLVFLVTGFISVRTPLERTFAGKLFGIIGAFVMYNAAISVAWWNFVRGKSIRVWATARQ